MTALSRRIATGALFIPCLVVITYHGGLPFLTLVDLITFTALLEFYQLVQAKGFKPHRILGLFFGLLAGWLFFHNFATWFLTLFLAALLILSMVREGFRRGTTSAIGNISTTVFGVVYVGILMGHLVGLRQLPLILGQPYPLGASYALLPFFVTWWGDTGAYFVGARFGRHKLVPRISPNKSVEGAIAGFLTSIGICFWARAWFAPYLNPGDCIILGGLAGIVGPAGDLVESLLKREVNVKDSSNTIPGHGGALDRFDSLLFNIPLAYYYLVFVKFR